MPYNGFKHDCGFEPMENGRLIFECTKNENGILHKYI